jgi:hypothetical protein
MVAPKQAGDFAITRGIRWYALENEYLCKVVRLVRSRSDRIQGTAGVASGNSELSARAQRQASSLEETVSAMEELTSTVRLIGQARPWTRSSRQSRDSSRSWSR